MLNQPIPTGPGPAAATPRGGRRLTPQPGAGRSGRATTPRPPTPGVRRSRDKTIHDDVNELTRERRNGCAWFNTSPEKGPGPPTRSGRRSIRRPAEPLRLAIAPLASERPGLGPGGALGWAARDITRHLLNRTLLTRGRRKEAEASYALTNNLARPDVPGAGRSRAGRHRRAALRRPGLGQRTGPAAGHVLPSVMQHLRLLEEQRPRSAREGRTGADRRLEPEALQRRRDLDQRTPRPDGTQSSTAWRIPARHGRRRRRPTFKSKRIDHDRTFRRPRHLRHQPRSTTPRPPGCSRPSPTPRPATAGSCARRTGRWPNTPTTSGWAARNTGASAPTAR